MKMGFLLDLPAKHCSLPPSFLAPINPLVGDSSTGEETEESSTFRFRVNVKDVVRGRWDPLEKNRKRQYPKSVRLR